MCMFVFIDADSWDLIIRDFLRCMKKEMRKSWHRKESAIKIVTNSFPKKYTSSFKYMKRTEVSWGVHTLYVFRSQQDKKNFQSMTLVLLCQVKLNIARPNGYAKQNKFLLHFLTNKPRPQLSGSRKKRKTFCTQGTINDNAELSPTRQSKAGSHHIHSNYVLWKEEFKQSFFLEQRWFSCQMFA